MDTTTTKPDRDLDHDSHAAGLYRAMALRFYSRYVDMRTAADLYGNDLTNHGPLMTPAEADRQYEATVGECLIEAPGSAKAALALVEFAGILAADRLIGEVLMEPVNDERDAYHQAHALANVAGWINHLAIAEFTGKVVERVRAREARQ